MLAVQDGGEPHAYPRHLLPQKCKRERCPLAPNPEPNKPDLQYTEAQGGYINFRRSNVSLAHGRQLRMSSDLMTFVNKQGLSSEDILIVTFGLHYHHEEEHRRDIQSLATWLNSLSNPPHILILHVPPQHFGEQNGNHVANRDYTTMKNCLPITSWNDSAHNKKLLPQDWRNEGLEEIIMPLVKQKKAFIVPISMGLNGRHDSHIGWGDCTHWCFPSTVYRYMHMMIFNALERVLSRKQHSTIKARHYANDDWWKSHPALQDGLFIQFHRERSIYLVERGVLREFQSWNAFVSRGGDTSNVVRFSGEELGPVQFGEGIL